MLTVPAFSMLLAASAGAAQAGTYRGTDGQYAAPRTASSMMFECEGFSVRLGYVEERLPAAGSDPEVIGRARRVRLERLQYNELILSGERLEQAEQLFSRLASINGARATCYQDEIALVLDAVTRSALVNYLRWPEDGAPERSLFQVRIDSSGIISADAPR